MKIQLFQVRPDLFERFDLIFPAQGNVAFDQQILLRIEGLSDLFNFQAFWFVDKQGQLFSGKLGWFHVDITAYLDP
jgi:hypothetical protein